MSELAFNMNGEPFEVPVTATGWRVRRMKAKGAPEVVYGREGTPLVLPLDASIDDLRIAVGAPGRYRVDPVDEFRPIPNASAGYVFVHEGDAPVASASGLASAPLAPLSGNVVIEAMRMNSEVAKAVVDRFPQMMEAAAVLLRAADGAGLPARPAMALADADQVDAGDADDADDANDEHAAKPPVFDLNALVAQIVPMIVMGIGNGKMKLPNLGEMLDWRKATPSAKPKARDPKPAKVVEASEVVPDNATDVLPPIDPPTMAHFIAVQSALAPEEAAIAREVARDLSAAELRAWFDELSRLSVPEAVEKVRKLIAGLGKDGGAS